MKRSIPKISKLFVAIIIVFIIGSSICLVVKNDKIHKIEKEISKMISGEVFAEVQYDDYTEQLKRYSKKPISKAALGTVYNRLAYQSEQEGDWLGYYSNFGKAVYYLEKSENYNDEINLLSDLVFYVYYAGGNFDLATQTLNKIDSLVAKCKNLDNLTETLVYQRHAQLAYYLDDFDKALVQAEKAKACVSKMDQVYSESLYNAAQFLIAKINILNNDYTLAEELIEQNKDSPAFEYADTVSMLNTNFFIPFFQLQALVSAHNADEETLRMCIKEIFQRARIYDFQYAVTDTLKLIRENNSLSSDFKNWLLNEELQGYKEYIAKKSQTYSYICNALIDTYFYEINDQEIEHTKNMRIGHIMVTLILCLVLFVIFLVILRNRLDTDVLTGIGNRRAFDRALKRNLKKQIDYSIIMIDIDDFKLVNDTYGHAEGDSVLQKIGAIFKEREEDKRIMPYRYGGEEFSFIIYGNEILKGKEIAESLRYQIECHKWEKVDKITISAGFGTTVNDADLNLYKAKHNGKNQVI